MPTTKWKTSTSTIIEAMGKKYDEKKQNKNKEKANCKKCLEKKKKRNKKCESFSNIPMFEVLSTRTTEEQEEEQEEVGDSSMVDETVVEGFKEGACPRYNIFCDDYYKNLGNRGISNSYDLWKKLMDMIQYMISPVTDFDKKLEDAILNLLKNHLLGVLDNCMTYAVKDDQDPYNKAKKYITRGFTWENPNKKRETFVIKEGIANSNAVLRGGRYYEDTIDSLSSNHPHYDPIKLAEYYRREADAFYKKNNNRVSEKMWFEFNSHFDENVLTDPAVIVYLTGVLSDTDKRYKSYKKKKYKYLFANNKINIDYRPFPEKSGFDQNIITILKDYSETDKALLTTKTHPRDRVEAFLSNALIGAISPMPEISLTEMNNIKIKKSPISDYLNTMVNCLCFIYYHETAVGFSPRSFYAKYTTPPRTFWFYIDLLCKIGSVYTDCLNLVAYYKELKYIEVDLTLEERTLFDLCFYNMMVFQTIPGTNTDKNRIIIKICTYINKNRSDGKDTRKHWTPTTDQWSPFPETDISDFITKMLDENDHYPLNKDVCDYYKRDEVSECLLQYKDIMKQCKKYANTIKTEIYRFLLIPVVVVIVYNLYYLLFFKDVFGYAKDYDESGEPRYHQDISGCYFPIFPNWENEFHKIEQHKLDFFLEFIFKPLSLFTVLLNWSKDMFRYILNMVTDTLFSTKIDNNRISYLLFMASFVISYAIIDKHWVTFYGIVRDLINLQIPAIPVKWGDSNESFYSISIIIVWMCFAYSLWNNGICGDINTSSSFAYMGGVSFTGPILFILYWVFKGMLTRYFIPLSVVISILYIIWMGTCSIFNYTENSHTYMDKIEMMHRVIYTKLFELDASTNILEYFLKNVSFYFVFFIIEITIIYTIYTSMTVFNKMEVSSQYVTGNGRNTNANAEKALTGIKTFLYVLCIMCVVLTGLWSINKYMSQISALQEFYNPVNGNRRLDADNCDPAISSTNLDGERGQDFYGKYDQEKIDKYNAAVANPVDSYGYTYVWNSSEYNNLFVDYYMYKTGHIVKRPIIKQMINKLNGYAKRFESFMNESNAYTSEVHDVDNRSLTQKARSGLGSVLGSATGLMASSGLGSAAGAMGSGLSSVAGAMGSGLSSAAGAMGSGLSSAAGAMGSVASAMSTGLGSGMGAMGSVASAMSTGLGSGMRSMVPNSARVHPS